MKDKLINAIKNRLYISFTYSGLYREAQPVALGLSRTGKLVLRCYQTAGGHITPGHEWDLCEVDKIIDLNILDRRFIANPPGYKKGDKHMNMIFEEI